MYMYTYYTSHATSCTCTYQLYEYYHPGPVHMRKGYRVISFVMSVKSPDLEV